MDATADLEGPLRDALGHLYDPSYRPPEPLWAATGCDPGQGTESVRAAILRAIESLHPGSDVPANARVRRICDLLHLRYVQNLTSEETAQRLNITSRHLRREQQEAIAVLARRLAEQAQSGTPRPARPAPQTPAAEAAPSADRPADRYAQLRQELVSLQRSAPGSLADVGETLRGALELGGSLAARHGVSLVWGEVEPGLAAAIHPSALRQALVVTIGWLLQNMSTGQITFAAGRAPGGIAISVTGHPAHLDRLAETNLIGEIVAAQSGSLDVRVEGDRAVFRLELPSADEITVLVVDDNPDIVHFYRRYTTDTRYRIVHVIHGQQMMETVETVVPQIIVLDVMLPDMDGWQLLSHLHEHPATRDVPVVICSVIQQEELALALGAALCLPKPVRRGDFIEALDRAARLIKR